MSSDDRQLSDLRQEARYRVSFSAEVRTNWEQCSSARVTDLSRLGVRIEGDRKLVESVFPNFNPPKGSRRPSVDILFDIGQEVTQPKGSVSFSCQTVYVRRIGADLYQIGMQFVQIGEQSQELLEALVAWLEQHQPPVETP